MTSVHRLQSKWREPRSSHLFVRKRTFTDRALWYVQNIACPGFGHSGIYGHRFRTGVSVIARAFAYVRVSTVGQTVENQIAEIKAAGFAVDQRRIGREI